MTDRRRNLFILLLVFGLLLASGVVVATKETRLGLDLEGGVSLVYEATPTPQEPVLEDEAIERAIEVIRDRIDALGVDEPEIQRSGGDQLNVSLPGVADTERAADQVGRVAQLYFYDWEESVVGPDGSVGSQDPTVTGGQAAGGIADAVELYGAVQRAKGVEPEVDGDNTHEGLFYLVNTQEREVLEGPEPVREELFDGEQVPEQLPDNVRIEAIPPGVIILRAQAPDNVDADEVERYYILRDDPALRGTDIENPEQNRDSSPGGTGQPIVTFEFTEQGRTQWEAVTSEIAQRGLANRLPGQPPDVSNQHFAIVLDNALISVPQIDYQENPDGIDGRSGAQISGGFTIQGAQDLASVLQTGALPVDLELISQNQISATLGAESLRQGIIAGIAGFAIVALALMLFYRVLGVIAVAALFVYGLYFFALMKLIPVTLTLPGIAGLILTLGVAADANIVIFERVKEEIRGGRSVAAGLAAGYKKGLTTIIDANVVTVLVAFILFVLATSGVRGFALTLGLGTIVSFFTAVLFTQAIIGTTARMKFMRSKNALGAGKPKRPITFDFMGKSKWFFSASGLILVIGALAIGGQGIDFSIDFESGTQVRASLEEPAEEDEIRGVLSQAGLAETEVQEVTGPGTPPNTVLIATEALEPAEIEDVSGALDDAYGGGETYSATSIGPSFGQSVAQGAIYAVIASLLVISAYIALRFEAKTAVPILIAIMHDLLITAGVYALLGAEVSTATVAALLTILGFSLYDTIIVFDRVRENTPRLPRATFSQIMNRSLSEVIVRSLNTSFCTLLPVLALFFFGGETLRDFALALIIGTASGTYSSVFIAGPVLTAWKDREPIYRRRRARLVKEFGHVPAYPTATVGGEPAEVAPREETSEERRRRLTTPDDPQQNVSQAEWQQMMRDSEDERTRASTATVARRQQEGDADEEGGDGDESAQRGSRGRDLSPDEVVMPGREKKQPKGGAASRRSRRHGRNR
ncbi:MAG: protein translocase subunit SecD [Solirubrobacteraceae bacterium]